MCVIDDLCLWQLAPDKKKGAIKFNICLAAFVLNDLLYIFLKVKFQCGHGLQTRMAK